LTDLKGFGEVWYHPSGIANILSMSLVENFYPVTYTKSDGFVVHKTDGTIRQFTRSKRGLYYMDTSTMKHAADRPTCETTLVNTVEDKQSTYTAKAYQMAQLARKIQCMIRRPSLRDYLRIVDNNQLVNCPVTRKDVMAAEDIFGPDVGSLKGKTVRRSSPQVTHAHVMLPPEVHERNRSITLGVDIMFVNKLPFFITVSKEMKFGTVNHIDNRRQETILECIKRVCNLYKLGGFHVDQIDSDKKFTPLRSNLADMEIGLNAASDDEHVGRIERYIRTTKEQTRSVWNTIPFTKIPNRMVIELVKGSVSWMNMFPADDGISQTLGPHVIITGQQADYQHHCRIETGSYVQPHEKHDNTMRTRTIGAIALRPNGNAQGGYYFLSLSTGRRIDRQNWTELPMPADVIERVHALARRDKAATGLNFAWRDGNPVTDDDGDDTMADPDYDPRDDDSEDDDVDDDESHTDEPDQAPIAGVIDDEDVEEEEEVDEDVEEEEEVDEDVEEEEEQEQEEHVEGNDNNNPGEPPQMGDDDGHGQDEQEQHDPAGVGTPTNGEPRPHGLWPKKPPNYNRHLGTTARPAQEGMLHANLKDLEHIALTQYSAKKGLQVFGEAGAKAIISEMTQLDVMDVIEPKMANMLTKTGKRAALEYLMFLKQKHCGKIKGRGCADGRKQRLYMNKEDTSSPTVTTEGLLLSCTIDAKEGRDVATADIPGAFMQTDMDATVHVRLSGPLFSLLVRVNPGKYAKFVSKEGGKPVMHVLLKKALYGTVQVSLLFWRDVTKELKKWGFTINPYDECVANKMVDGKQCTVLWHVDDLKISHINSKVVDDVVAKLSERYGKRAPLTVTHGLIHEYLGMTIDFSTKGKVMIKMDDYVDGVLEAARDDMSGVATSPAADHLYDVNETDPVFLKEEDGNYFHTMTAKLLFLAKRARPDIQQGVAFLTTRVRRPDADDYKKLTRVIKYLRADPHLPLTLEADDSLTMKWWVDASFAVHPDMKSHTGATGTLGKGSVYTASTRQQLNTKSSTEAELVAVDDVMPMILLMRYFLHAQGYGMNGSLIYQDNQSAILLEKNGRASSGKRTRHINIRYFLVADRVKAKEVQIEYCPTERMLADYLTKPLQGANFLWFRNNILNVQEKV
jgi:hypothetical protein